MSEKLQTNQDVVERVNRLTTGLVARAGRLGLAPDLSGLTGDKSVRFPGTPEDPGTRLTTNVGPYGKRIEVSVGNTVHSAQLIDVHRTADFTIKKEEVGLVDGQARTLSETAVRAKHSDGQYGPLNVTQSFSEDLGRSTGGLQQFDAAEKQAHPQTVQMAAEGLGAIRGAIAAAEIAQQGR
jgi:hypothetical protein